MIPGLGDNYGITVEVVSKPREEYADESYSRLGLPAAPAIMIDDHVLVEKSDISQEDLEAGIRRFSSGA